MGRTYQCQDCPKIFTGQPGYQYHYAKEHNGCILCNLIVNDDIFKHMSSKHDWKVFCKYCKSKFLESDKLIRHEIVQHFACSGCEIVHKTIEDMMNHLHEQHPKKKVKLVKCNSCPKISWPVNIKHHMNNCRNTKAR